MVGIENYENLANAIILQAVSDYKTIAKELHKVVQKKDEMKRSIAMQGLKLKTMRLYTEIELQKEYENIIERKKAELQSIERFFKSDYYNSLSKTDGSVVIKAVNLKIKTII